MAQQNYDMHILYSELRCCSHVSLHCHQIYFT